ncbi:endoribonuclease l-psp [Grosmannia clavigera kw1407]|uniref:Endoribonuclease l-psp n=1 Tax=Grosmannia clavigera (strain kw1407 / UAMH 11150) TaxID=655863 RepID=F0XB47_GROCL|nr:endoribonuclease l-psp [Grosmannia clavigera kw1407]EFX04952.1 endoribonuclease l-psp [Grosmannia clavigera kw1407]
MEYRGCLDEFGIKAINSPGLGEKLGEALGLSGAVVIPANTATVRTSGTTGVTKDMVLPASATEQIMLAFQNVEDTMVAAGVKDGWRAVFDLTTYHTGPLDDPEVNTALEAAFEMHLKGNKPTWAAIGVANLYQGARIEVRVTAALKA